MDQATQLLVLVGVAALGILASVFILRRQRMDRADQSGASDYATSTEGEKRCPHCGMFNMWTDRNCISCGKRLPG
jgi:hypothetical protein